MVEAERRAGKPPVRNIPPTPDPCAPAVVASLLAPKL
jgi:hypothetical protein